MNITIAVCGNFEPEVRRVLEGDDLRGDGVVGLVTLPTACGRPPLTLETLSRLCETAGAEGPVELLAGACGAGLSDRCGPCSVHHLRQCFDVVAPPALVDHHLAAGAYLVTPGWLANWRARLEVLGVDGTCAPAIFSESMRRVVLLDTGVAEESADRLREFATFVGLTAEIVPVGLDYVRLYVARLVGARRLEAERAESLGAVGRAHRRSADHAAAFDLLSTLTEIAEERQVIERALDVFCMLFAPNRATFVSVLDGAPAGALSRPPSEVDPVTLMSRLRDAEGCQVIGPSSFGLPIKHSGELLGFVELEGIAAPEHLDRAFVLAQTVASTCGLAVSNARKYEAVKRAETERRVAVEFLRLVNASVTTADLVHAATTFFQEQSSCEAVGIRLKDDDDDYPYYEARGFPKEFLQLENNLCVRDEAGNARRDREGNPVIECMCGNVICGRTNPDKPFFTVSGSFWSNGTTGLLATTSDEDRQARTRNRCNGEGYESVALLPLRVGDHRLGLLQLNDRRTGMFTPETIALWERLAGYLAVAVAKTRADEARRTSEEALRAANARLVEEDERKNEFLAILSHELRNPLAPIRNSIYILERAAPGGEQSTRAREVIDRQARHLTRLIDDLLDVTRIARGKVRLQRERIELGRMVLGTVEDVREDFRRSGIDLGVSVTEEPLFIDGDPIRIAQMIGNLLQNAAKFTHRGGHVRITLEAGSEGQAVIQVRDDGAGIQPEVLARLFEPFVQADRTLDRSRGGLGLGLALVRGLALLHGGTVRAESEGPGKGTLFTLELPLDLPANRRLKLVPAAELRGKTGGVRILLIEDNLDAAETLKEALELSGHRVEFALDGAAGIARAEACRPHVVLCDIGLPGLDGYCVARAMRADPKLRATFLVALSGYASPEDVEKAKAAGFDRHMAKPPDLTALEKILADLPARASAG